MEEELYYSCSENKGADQLRGYREADLRLCFRICKKPVFLRRCSYKLLIGCKFDDNLLRNYCAYLSKQPYVVRPHNNQLVKVILIGTQNIKLCQGDSDEHLHKRFLWRNDICYLSIII